MKNQQVGSWLAIAAGVGTAITAATQNIAAGVAVGVAFFIAFNAKQYFKKD